MVVSDHFIPLELTELLKLIDKNIYLPHSPFCLSVFLSVTSIIQIRARSILDEFVLEYSCNSSFIVL